MFFGVNDLDGVCAGFQHRLGTRQVSALLFCGALFHHRGLNAHGHIVFTQGFAGVRGGVHAQRFGRAFGDQEAASVTAFGAEVDQPIAGTDHVQVVLDHDQGMPRFQQAAQGAHQLGDVVKVQARCRLIEQEQRALARGGLSAGCCGLGGFGQKAGQLEALRLATAEGGHRLSELHIFQAHVDDGLQGPNHLAVVGEQSGSLTHRQVEDVCHIVKMCI